MIDSTVLKEQIRQRINLVDVVSQHVLLKRAGKDYIGLCPFHQEKTPSFSVSASKGIFKCFGCGAGGDVFTFIQLREGVTFPEAMRMLADRCGVDYDAAVGRRDPSQTSRLDLAKVNAWAAAQFQGAFADDPSAEIARSYVADRGITADMTERFGLGFAADDPGWITTRARAAGMTTSLLSAAGLLRTSDASGDLYCPFRMRLMFPIRDTMNRVIGFGGRTLKDDKAKYLNTAQTPLFDKGRNLYGLDLARESIANTRRAVVVEGYTDCIAAHQYGFANTVATLGTALTDDHVNLLRRWCDELILVFDTDNAGQRAADRAISVALRYNLSVRIGRIPEGKDPFDLLTSRGTAAFQDVLNNAGDALLFKWHRTCERFQTDAPGSGGKKAISEFVGLVAEMIDFGAIDSIQKGLIVNQLAQLLAQPAGEIQSLLVDAKKRRSRQATGGSAPSLASPAAVAPPMVDAEQTALTTLLALLIHDPGLYPEVAEGIRLQQLNDERLRRIAAASLELCASGGGFDMTELLSALGDPEDARSVTDLWYQASRIEDPRLTVSGCLQRLAQTESSRRVRDHAEKLRSGNAIDEDDRLLQITRDQSSPGGFGRGRSNSAVWTRYCKQ